MRSRLTQSSSPAVVVAMATLAAAAAACSGRDLTRAFDRTTPRERYVAALEDAGLTATALGSDWLRAGARALRSPVEVELPFREAGYFPADEATATGYRLLLRRGHRVDVTLSIEGLRPMLIFLELHEPADDSARSGKPVAAADSGATALAFEPPHDGAYVLRIQPELLRAARYTLTIEAGAAFAFPVPGRDNRAVLSRFGAPRDRGARLHHGVDIFAPRGTPVLAATGGVVRSVGTNALGGNVIWLWDPRRRQVLYYAHLDTQLVHPGAVVRPGDTLGLVGNTGNAASTRPHLHFGIYRRGEGPIDPFPWIDTAREPPPPISADTGRLGGWVRFTGPRMMVRLAPEARAVVVDSVPAESPVRVAAASRGWYRVTSPAGQVGFVPSRVATPTVSPDSAARRAVGGQ